MLYVTMSVTAESGNANLFWRSDSQSYSSSRSADVALRRKGEKYTYAFRIGNGPGEAIREFSLDPASASGAEIAIDRIEAVYVDHVDHADYHFANHSEGWNPYRDEATRQIEIPVVKDGILATRSTGSDPILQMTTPLRLVGDDIDQITVRSRQCRRCQISSGLLKLCQTRSIRHHTTSLRCLPGITVRSWTKLRWMQIITAEEVRTPA